MIVLLVFLLPAPAEAAQGEPVVRVLLLEKQETVKIGGSMEITGLKEPMIIQGEKILTLAEVKDMVHIVADSGILEVNGQPYRGEILVKSKPDGLMVINRIEMEDYLFGVLACEVNPEWPFEMLKAQAVAARCFALVQSQTKMSQDFDLYCDTRSQVYKGKTKEHPRTNEAVKQTRGIVALHQGQVIQAVFSASSGGKTANSEDVWGKPLPYLRSVTDYDQTSPYAAWKISFSAKQVEETLKNNGVDVGQLKNIIAVERDSSDRVRLIRIVGERGQVVIAGTKFRSMFNLKSTNFSVANALVQSKTGTGSTMTGSGKTTASQGTESGGSNPSLPKETQKQNMSETGTAQSGANGASVTGSEGLATEKGLEPAGFLAETIAIYLFQNTLPTLENQTTAPSATNWNRAETTGGVTAGGSVQPNSSLLESIIWDKSLTQEILNTLPLVELEIRGSGYGHGVGMSQWGAREMATAGASYKQILLHYYQGVEIVRLY